MDTTFFEVTPFYRPDAIFALTEEYHRDASSCKVNLGQGTYCDGEGKPWVLPSVREARTRLSREGLVHEYLPIAGHAEFRRAAIHLLLGEELWSSKKDKISSCQSISGTGGLHLAGALVRRYTSCKPHVYITNPSWSNHEAVFASLDFVVHKFQYHNAQRASIDFVEYLAALKSAEPGSVFVLHACAHNPTGCDPTESQWRQIGRIMKERRLFPIFDAAYLGFNSGSFDKDAYAFRYFLGELEMEAVVCLSFAKNMGLYGERVGCTAVVSRDADSARRCQSTLETLQRSEISNPPAYGAKIASKILNTPELRKQWCEDLVTMSSRIRRMRMLLYEQLNYFQAPGNWEHILKQSGMFGFLGLPQDIVLELRRQYHIYMADNSRISLAGLHEGNLSYVAKAIAACLRGRQNVSSGLQPHL